MKSEYRLSIGAPVGRGLARETLASRQLNHTDTVIYEVEEWFDNFKAIDGLTMPFTWRVRITVQPARTECLEWVTTYDQVVTNPPGVTDVQVFGH